MSIAKVALPDKLNELAKARASERGCKNLEEYVRLLIREDSPSPFDEKLEAQLLQSLRSRSRKVTSQFWAEKRRKLLPWPQYYQGNGVASEFSSKLGLVAVPQIFVIDRKGNFARSADGMLEFVLNQMLHVEQSIPQ